MPAGAQARLGDLSLSMNGDLSPGYSATSGNEAGSSSHSFTFGGDSSLTGSYHSPNFLSFNAGLYLNQSRANSDFQSISNASGVDLSTTIFGGSEFPGNVGYSLAYNSDGNYGIPGLANYVTHGNSDGVSINWSENIRDMPSFSAGYEMGNSKYTVYGTDDNGTSAFDAVNLHTSYQLAGFNVGAFYSDGGGHSLIPEVISGAAATTAKSSSDSYGFDASHFLPMQGSAMTSFSRSGWNTDYAGSSSSGTIDLMSAQAAMRPLEKLTFSVSANYSDNLSGQLVESILASGGVVPGLNLSQTSNSLDLMAVAGYSPTGEVQTSFSAERRTQTYLGESYDVMSYGVGANYAHEFRFGTFNTGVDGMLNTDEQTGDNTLGFSGTETYTGEFKDWHVNGSFNYAQNVETLLVTYMNSYYNFSASAHRRWGRLNVSAGAAAGRTALTDQAGTESSSQSYNASVGYGARLTATGNYARAAGLALATGAGLIPVPVPSPVLPSSLLSMYGGNSYAISLASTPVSKLTIAASYSKSLSNTASGGLTSNNENDEYNALIQYQVRKLNFISGYARLEQGFSGAGTPPQIVASYYAGISRWFKFF